MATHKKRYRQLADAIAADIKDQGLVAGDRLPTERELAAQYKVSRPTLREALITLEILGVVDIRHGFGIMVVDRRGVLPGPVDGDIGGFELIEARRFIEGEVAALAATQASNEDIEELEKLLNAMGDNDQEVAVVADRDFHQLISQIAGNGALSAVVDALWEWRYRSPLAKNILERANDLGMNDRIDEHGAILKAIKKKSPNDARRAMHSHLDNVIEHLLRATEIQALDAAQNEIRNKRNAYASKFKAVAK